MSGSDTDDESIIDGEKELFEHHRYVADKGQQIIRIDKYLFSHVPNTTRTRIQNAAEAGNILVNNKTVKSSYKVKPGDVITIVLAYPPKEISILPENIPLDIVYEDDDILVINKKAGMVVHPAFGNFTGTLIHALLYYLNGKEASLKASLDNEKSIRPGLLHRLDKNTSGLIIIAKNELALAILGKEMFDRQITRRYVALVWGVPKEKEGTIIANVGRNLSNRKKMATFPEGDHGKHAVTHYKVLESFKYVSLVECKLETGRTHQIRVHMKHIGHTVFGDTEYGGDIILKSSIASGYKEMVEKCFRICSRQALHAKYLSFNHPITKKNLRFETDLADDIAQVLEIWKKFVKS